MLLIRRPHRRQSRTRLLFLLALPLCGAEQPAEEEAGRGVFTSALLDILCQIDIAYKDLIPICQGISCRVTK
jgi:hypothetical protein